MAALFVGSLRERRRIATEPVRTQSCIDTKFIFACIWPKHRHTSTTDLDSALLCSKLLVILSCVFLWIRTHNKIRPLAYGEDKAVRRRALVLQGEEERWYCSLRYSSDAANH